MHKPINFASVRQLQCYWQSYHVLQRSLTYYRQVCDAYGLGLGEPLPISAAHNEGMTDLMQKLHEVSRNESWTLE